MIESKLLPKGVECKPYAQHDTLLISKEGAYFQQMLNVVVLHGRTLPHATLRNPDGSQYTLVTPYETLIKEAVFLTEEAFRICKEKGWSAESPTLDVLYDPSEAQKVGF